MNTVVIGLGNDLRRDDGIGPSVAREVAEHVSSDVCVSVSEGDPAALLDTWTSADLAVVVDAVVREPPRPGTMHRLTPEEVVETEEGLFSTHGLRLDDILRLGEALGRLPRRMIIFAVEVADLGCGRGLSPAVVGALESTVSAVLAAIDEATGQAPENVDGRS
ncbi:hydrogenase maturation protease [Rhodococcus sp. WMMA185]|uniref:hydrogenase maturation protease n=1 Tax=Rhodococcus sp. WMMA185 TaxID=679318 RepID=UPI000878A66F|nr:hydrogenase maturation protease [Rhodococcus sp. WMMA185]AOW92643.1 hydrogenase maturation protease [Rhodococcus sp. WMMA185]